MIENFAALSLEEQKAFAESLIKTINSESNFSSEVDFEITGIEADDMTGGLRIEVDHTGSINVPRAASWTAADDDEAYSDPGYEADYFNSIYDDAKKAFKTLEAVIEGYKVSLDIADVDEDDTVEVEVDSSSAEDSGIGSYEYWGSSGYDSHPYVEVKGTITKACTCGLTFYVEPADETPATEETDED